MRRALIEEILRGQDHVAADGNRFSIPDGLRVELLVSSGSEVVAFGALRTLRLEELYAAVTTEKDESYFVEYESVFGVKVRGKAEGRPIGRTGFAPG